MSLCLRRERPSRPSRAHGSPPWSARTGTTTTINAAVDLAEQTAARIALHPDVRMLWDHVHAERLLSLPLETAVHTGHGNNTTIRDRAPALQEWIDRGH